MSTQRARQLRQNRTEAEKRLWARLRRKRVDGFRFRQQAPIGKYIADFACFEAKLIVELDGGQHADRAAADTTRTAWLAAEGFQVLRFWNNEVFENIESVEAVIQAALWERSARLDGENHPLGNECHPLPGPPPSRGRGKYR